MKQKLQKHFEKIVLHVSIFMLPIIFVSNYAGAQDYRISNPVDISQPWATEINPAVISSQYTRISIGLKVFQYGFLPDKSLGLNESHINASFPFHLPIAFGCGLRYFSAGIYSEFEGSIMLSKKITGQFSIGTKIGLGRIGFAKQDFNVVDPDDPLLISNLSKMYFNLGMGLFWNSDKWSLGIGVDHTNSPDIGFQTTSVLSPEIYAGVGYKFGKMMPSLILHKFNQAVSYGAAITLSQDRMGLIRLSFENTMPVKMEVQLNLSRNNSLQYGLNLPTKELSSVSVGTHEVVYNHVLGRGPDIGQPKVLISSDTMRIYQERIVRSMSNELSLQVVENVKGLIPEYLELNGKSRNVLIVPAGVLNQYETKTITHQRYTNLGNLVERSLQESPNLDVILQADDRSITDAKILKYYLLKKGIILSQNINIASFNTSENVNLDGFIPGRRRVSFKRPTCSEKSLVISLKVSGKTRQVKDWRLTIYTDQKKVIKTFQGEDKLPDHQEWDWTDQWGELIPPGRYVCLISLHALSGKKRIAASQPIKVKRLNRTVSLCFGVDSQRAQNKIDYGHDHNHIHVSSRKEQILKSDPDFSY